MNIEQQSGGDESQEKKNSLKEILVELFPGWEKFFNAIFKDESVDDDPRVQEIEDASREERAELARDIVSQSPLVERGEEIPENIMRIPTDISKLGGWNRETGPNNRWVKYEGEIYWSDHHGFLVSTNHIRWAIRSGFDADVHENLEEFMDGHVRPATFFNIPIQGGLAPDSIARLRQVEQAMRSRGIDYGREAGRKIDSIHGYSYRAIGADGRGKASEHCWGHAMDFDKNEDNKLLNIPNGTFNDYMNEVDYSLAFYNIMEEFGFMGFRHWLANRGSGTYDTMQFQEIPDINGRMTGQIERTEDYLV